MLIVISDVHLGDGSCGRSIAASAFHLFADRLQELAFNASWRADESYCPLESIDVLLLGDILDPLHSTLWLDKGPGEQGYVRPWSDVQSPVYAEKLQEITSAILRNNTESAEMLSRCTRGEIIRLPPADRRGSPALKARERVAVPIRIYYMAGNHDWYYHIPGPPHDAIRQEIIRAFGLSNDPSPFPHEAGECGAIQELFARYKIYARHGDLYDTFNYCPAKGRNAATLGDAFTVEILNRFPLEVKKRLGDEIPSVIVDGLRELTNVRPALATPLWISGQLRQNKVPPRQQKKLKKVWDDLGEEFLDMPLVREADRRFRLDIVDGLEVLLRLTRRASFKTIDEVVAWVRQKMWSGELTFAHNALKERAFLDRTAQYIVYGHTHRHEIVPLDLVPAAPRPSSQIYLNSGTWHTYYDLAVYKPEEQRFVPYQVLTYLAFYKDDERQGRHFEAWSGSFT